MSSTNINYISDEGKLIRRKFKTAVVLFNMGEPRNASENLAYLKAIFTDKDIMVNLPLINILGRFIAYVSNSKNIEKHLLIGGYSYLHYWSEVQGEMLRQYLDIYSPESAPHKIYEAFRYSSPTIEEAIQKIRVEGITRCVAYMQYPQYSTTTTLSSLRELDRKLDIYDSFGTLNWSIITSFHNHQSFIKVLAEHVLNKLKNYPEKDRNSVHILYSAHSLPISVVEQGDPYNEQIKETVSLLKNYLLLPNPQHIVYQSNEGKDWLKPEIDQYLMEVVREKGPNNVDVLVLPIAFTSDHVETLYDIDIVLQKKAKEIGIRSITRCESLNDDPHFIEALGQIFIDHLTEIKNNEKRIEAGFDIENSEEIVKVENNVKRYIEGPILSEKKQIINDTNKEKENIRNFKSSFMSNKNGTYSKVPLEYDSKKRWYWSCSDNIKKLIYYATTILIFSMILFTINN